MCQCRYFMPSIFMVATLFANGCASIQTIRPVAKLNVQNSEALAISVPTLVEITDQILHDRVRVAAITRYRELMTAIRKSPYHPNATTAADVAIHYKTMGDELVQKIKPVSNDPNVRTTHLREYPITAAVAFGLLSPESAAEIWLTHDATYDMVTSGRMSNAVAFETRTRVIKDLPAAQEVAQAEQDVLAAFTNIRKAILSQIDNSSRLSSELYSASKSSADIGTLFENLLGNENLQSLLGAVADSRTAGEAEAKKVDSLLESVLDNQNVVGMLTGGL